MAHDDSIAADKVVGIQNIADFIGEKFGETYDLLRARKLPAGRLGNEWIASRRKLREHYEQLVGLSPAPDALKDL
jgi:hypothetical protein